MGTLQSLLIQNVQWSEWAKILLIVIAVVTLALSVTLLSLHVASIVKDNARKNNADAKRQQMPAQLNKVNTALDEAITNTETEGNEQVVYVNQEANPQPLHLEELPTEDWNEAVEEESAYADEEPEIIDENNDDYVINSINNEEVVPVVVGGKTVFARYSYSFYARLIQADDVLKHRYLILKNELLSYGCKAYMSWGAESFRKGRKTYAKMAIRGKTLSLYLALEPKQYAGTKYIFEDVSGVTKYVAVPMRVRVRSDRGVKWSKELIADLAKKSGLTKVKFAEVDYVPDYQTTEDLVEHGFVKVLINNGVASGATGEFVRSGAVGGSDELWREEFHNLTGVDIVENVTAADADRAISNEVARKFVQLESVSDKGANGKKNIKKKKVVGIINVDTISNNFNAGDEITLDALVNKGLLSKNTSSFKVLARGEINKPITVISDDFSVQAVKMIVMTGGKVIVRKEDRVQ